MGQEMLWMLIPFVWTKSQSMKLPIALEFKSALTECILLVSVVLTSIGRIIDVVTNFIQPYLHQFFIDSHGINGCGKPLKRPFNRY